MHMMNRNFARCVRDNGADFYVCYECDAVAQNEFDIEEHMEEEHPVAE